MNTLFASEDGRKLGIFEDNTNHALLFNLIPSLDVLEVNDPVPGMMGKLMAASWPVSGDTSLTCISVMTCFIGALWDWCLIRQRSIWPSASAGPPSAS